eukprot:jgi/Botrbrau1/14886/Bobra.0248s0005.1
MLQTRTFNEWRPVFILLNVRALHNLCRCSSAQVDAAFLALRRAKPAVDGVRENFWSTIRGNYNKRTSLRDGYTTLGK